VVVSVVGATVLLIGLALIVLPGPAFLVIPVGLVILGTEFAWARRLVGKARALAAHAKSKATGQRSAAKARPGLSQEKTENTEGRKVVPKMHDSST
jgi:hypothetical protein